MLPRIAIRSLVLAQELWAAAGTRAIAFRRSTWGFRERWWNLSSRAWQRNKVAIPKTSCQGVSSNTTSGSGRSSTFGCRRPEKVSVCHQRKFQNCQYRIARPSGKQASTLGSRESSPRQRPGRAWCSQSSWTDWRAIQGSTSFGPKSSLIWGEVRSSNRRSKAQHLQRSGELHRSGAQVTTKNGAGP